jgi:hypothetical protein
LRIRWQLKFAEFGFGELNNKLGTTTSIKHYCRFSEIMTGYDAGGFLPTDSLDVLGEIWMRLLERALP